MSKQIAAFGEVMMRLEVPDYQLLTQTNTLHYSFSGTGVNFVAAMIQLGHEAYLVTTLPNNPLGDAAEAHVRKLGINPKYIHREGQYLGMYFLEKGFGCRPGRITYSNRLESSFNTASDGIYDFDAIAEQVDMVHFCGITLAMNDRVRKQLKQFAETVHKKGGKIIFDCNFRPTLWGENGHGRAKTVYEDMLHLADIVFMNEKDALWTLGLDSSTRTWEEQLNELIPQVSAQYQIPIIAGTRRTIHEDQTQSLRGFLYKNESLFFSEELTFAVYDRIGAGDAFASGIVHGECSNFSAQKTVDFAVTASMLAHTIAGDTPLSSERDILQALTKKIKDIQR